MEVAYGPLRNSVQKCQIRGSPASLARDFKLHMVTHICINIILLLSSKSILWQARRTFVGGTVSCNGSS